MATRRQYSKKKIFYDCGTAKLGRFEAQLLLFSFVREGLFFCTIIIDSVMPTLQKLVLEFFCFIANFFCA
jgi:hypothetical protein